jgi:thiazole/oxazole-forming peptide maturase SagD family component
MKLNPADTIARICRALEPGFTVMPLHAPDAPLFLAIALPGDEAETGLKPRLPAGRGMTTRQAMIAAGAEALELRASLVQHHLAEVQGLPRRDGLAMVAATDLLSHRPVAVPAQQVYLDCAAVLGEPLAEDANSTGCAAGADRDSALAAALCECVERDAVALWWHGRRPAAALALDLIDAQQPRLYWWLFQRERRTMLLDLTSDIGLPVVAAVSSDADGRIVATGTAARPVLAEAALAAVTEMVQTEVGMAMAREAGDPEVLAWGDHASTQRQPQFRAGTEARQHLALGHSALVERLKELGHPVLGIDLTLPGDPLCSVRVLVPGLCAMRGRIDTARFARLCPEAPSPHLPEPY